MSEPPRHLDYWQPPPGVGDPVACLATSFTFDSEFFESQCLARFFGLDSPRGDKGGPDLAYLLQTEEKLAEAQVGVIVDRSVRVGKRSLRWDVIPVGVRGGLQHSKVSVLLWQRLARFMISSANLTPAGYRNQIEAVVVFDAHPTSSVPEPLLLELVGALRRVLSRAATTLGSAGPVVRAGVILDQAERHISQCGLPEAISRGRMLASIATSGSGSTVLDAIQHVWVGGPPRRATVLSPFWDESGPKGAAVTALIQKLALRGPVAATFLAAVDPLNGTYRVPPSLRNMSTARLRAEIRAFATPDDRRLHAKVVVLESDTWTAGLVGSSNFTESGLGLSAHPHLEINLALGGPADSNIAVALRALVPVGELVPDGATFAEGEDEDERPEATLPWGFIECLLEPGERSILHLRLDPHDLPPSWSVSVPGGRVVLSSDEWRRDGSPAD